MGIALLSSEPAPASEADFANYLAGRDLVVEGTLVSATPVVRAPAGGCGTGPLPAVNAWDLSVAVRTVHAGIAEDSVVTITCLSIGTMPRERLVPGASVLAYSVRLCEDGWRHWGSVLYLGDDGVVTADQLDSPLLPRDREGTDSLPGLERLRAELDARCASIGSTAFRLDGGVALVRLGHVRSDSSGYTYACDSLRWVLPTEGRVPQELTFTRQSYCNPFIAPGDSLLIPIPRGSVARLARMPYCPRAFVVRNAYAVGLGTPLASISRAIETTGNTRALRPVLRAID